jgi:hypothetical protein
MAISLRAPKPVATQRPISGEWKASAWHGLEVIEQAVRQGTVHLLVFGQLFPRETAGVEGFLQSTGGMNQVAESSESLNHIFRDMLRRGLVFSRVGRDIDGRIQNVDFSCRRNQLREVDRVRYFQFATVVVTELDQEISENSNFRSERQRNGRHEVLAGLFEFPNFV